MFNSIGKMLRGRPSESRDSRGARGDAVGGGPADAKGGVRVKVVGVGGAGGNAVSRMARARLRGVDFLALNTDAQALKRVKGAETVAIGPNATGGMGSGGNPELGRKAARESCEQIAALIDDADMVFVAAGMGGGTGAGAAPLVAEMARKRGALTVGVVTLPFSFEGRARAELAERGLRQLRQKVDTLIVIENDRLLDSLDDSLSLERGFRIADETLRQGIQGISEIITVPGAINVDFADVRSVMMNRGSAFMALGQGAGSAAAADAVRAALANPLFTAPIAGARGILFNVRGGRDLSLGHVREVAEIIESASKTPAQIVFGVVQDARWHKRVQVTLVATGIPMRQTASVSPEPERASIEPAPSTPDNGAAPQPPQAAQGGNGHADLALSETSRTV